VTINLICDIIILVSVYLLVIAINKETKKSYDINLKINV